MAIFHKKKNKLEEEYKALKAKQMRFRRYCVYAAIFFVFNFMFGPSIYGAFTVIGHLSSFALAGFLFFRSDNFGAEAHVIEVGIQGERATNEILSILPDTFHIIPNVEVTVDGKHSEMDTVVVGNTGVFIVETKNKTGTVYAYLDEHDWIQEKTSRRGETYRDTFYSPAKQVATHAYRLSTFLKSNGESAWVQGTVFFPNTACEVKVLSKDGEVNVPVFSVRNSQVIFPGENVSHWSGNSGFAGETNILKYIAYNKKSSLTDEQVIKIVNLIK